MFRVSGITGCGCVSLGVRRIVTIVVVDAVVVAIRVVVVVAIVIVVTAVTVVVVVAAAVDSAIFIPVPSTNSFIPLQYSTLQRTIWRFAIMSWWRADRLPDFSNMETYNNNMSLVHVLTIRTYSTGQRHLVITYI